MLHALLYASLLVLAAPPETASEVGFRPLFDGNDLASGTSPKGTTGTGRSSTG